MFIWDKKKTKMSSKRNENKSLEYYGKYVLRFIFGSSFLVMSSLNLKMFSSYPINLRSHIESFSVMSRIGKSIDFCNNYNIFLCAPSRIVFLLLGKISSQIFVNQFYFSKPSPEKVGLWEESAVLCFHAQKLSCAFHTHFVRLFCVYTNHVHSVYCQKLYLPDCL